MCVGGGIFMQMEFKRAKEVLGRWQRTRNEENEVKKELKDTKKAVEALREGVVSQYRLENRQLF
jgi:hypothetical protein